MQGHNKEVFAAREHCNVENMESDGEYKISIVSDNSNKSPSIKELPSPFVLKRWTKMVSKDDVFNVEGNLLQEKPRSAIEICKDKLALEIRSKMEELIHRVGGTNETLNFLRDRFVTFEEEVTPLIPKNVASRVEEIEAFAGCPIPKEVSIKPQNDVNSRVGASE